MTELIKSNTVWQNWLFDKRASKENQQRIAQLRQQKVLSDMRKASFSPRILERSRSPNRNKVFSNSKRLHYNSKGELEQKDSTKLQIFKPNIRRISGTYREELKEGKHKWSWMNKMHISNLKRMMHAKKMQDSQFQGFVPIDPSLPIAFYEHQSSSSESDYDQEELMNTLNYNIVEKPSDGSKMTTEREKKKGGVQEVGKNTRKMSTVFGGEFGKSGEDLERKHGSRDHHRGGRKRKHRQKGGLKKKKHHHHNRGHKGPKNVAIIEPKPEEIIQSIYQGGPPTHHYHQESQLAGNINLPESFVIHNQQTNQPIKSLKNSKINQSNHPDQPLQSILKRSPSLHQWSRQNTHQSTHHLQNLQRQTSFKVISRSPTRIFQNEAITGGKNKKGEKSIQNFFIRGGKRRNKKKRRFSKEAERSLSHREVVNEDLSAISGKRAKDSNTDRLIRNSSSFVSKNVIDIENFEETYSIYVPKKDRQLVEYLVRAIEKYDRANSNPRSHHDKDIPLNQETAIKKAKKKKKKRKGKKRRRKAPNPLHKVGNNTRVKVYESDLTKEINHVLRTFSPHKSSQKHLRGKNVVFYARRRPKKAKFLGRMNSLEGSDIEDSDAPQDGVGSIYVPKRESYIETLSDYSKARCIQIEKKRTKKKKRRRKQVKKRMIASDSSSFDGLIHSDVNRFNPRKMQQQTPGQQSVPRLQDGLEGLKPSFIRSKSRYELSQRKPEDVGIVQENESMKRTKSSRTLRRPPSLHIVKPERVEVISPAMDLTPMFARVETTPDVAQRTNFPQSGNENDQKPPDVDILNPSPEEMIQNVFSTSVNYTFPQIEDPYGYNRHEFPGEEYGDNMDTFNPLITKRNLITPNEHPSSENIIRKNTVVEAPLEVIDLNEPGNNRVLINLDQNYNQDPRAQAYQSPKFGRQKTLKKKRPKRQERAAKLLAWVSPFDYIRHQNRNVKIVYPVERPEDALDSPPISAMLDPRRKELIEVKQLLKNRLRKGRPRRRSSHSPEERESKIHSIKESPLKDKAKKSKEKKEAEKTEEKINGTMMDYDEEEGKKKTTQKKKKNKKNKLKYDFFLPTIEKKTQVDVFDMADEQLRIPRYSLIKKEGDDFSPQDEKNEIKRLQDQIGPPSDLRLSSITRVGMLHANESDVNKFVI